MTTGIDTAPAAASSAASGVSNRKANRARQTASTRSGSFPGQTVGQVARQGHRQVRVRPQLDVVDVLFPATALQLGNEGPDLGQVAVAEGARVGEQLGELLQAAEQRRLLKREIQLGPVQNMKQHDFVALVAQVAQPAEQVRHLVKEVAQDENQAAPGD